MHVVQKTKIISTEGKRGEGREGERVGRVREEGKKG